MWTAYLFQTTTGAIGPQLNFESMSWSISVNEIETLSIDATKADLPKIDRQYWLAPWWVGVVLLWDGTPIFGGPLISRPTESFRTLRMEVKGIRALFERRFAIRELESWKDLSRDKVKYTGLAYGTIGKRVIQLCQMKPGGQLPIHYPIPDETVTVDEDHQRTYDGYNLSNITGDAILTKLSEVVEGPDFMFKPRLVDGNSLVFDMLYGSSKHPHLPQTSVPTWDTTAVNGQVTDLDIVTTGSYQTTRVFATGAGTNESTLIAVETDQAALNKGFPMLETVQSYGDSIRTAAVLQNHAKGNLAANKDSLLQIQLTVRANGEHELGTFWPGNLVKVVVKDWIALADGTHNMRLLNMSGSQDFNVRMSLQLEK